MPGVMSPLRVNTQLIPAVPQLNDVELGWIMRVAGRMPASVESTRDESRWYSMSAFTLRHRRPRRSVRRDDALRHNNGMHLTANSGTLIRETWVVSALCARRVRYCVLCQAIFAFRAHSGSNGRPVFNTP